MVEPLPANFTIAVLPAPSVDAVVGHCITLIIFVLVLAANLVAHVMVLRIRAKRNVQHQRSSQIRQIRDEEQLVSDVMYVAMFYCLDQGWPTCGPRVKPL